LELSPWHLPQPNTYDFTLDEIASITPAGEDEVFDLQVERTENFIANGLVSHNTWWHDDDLAGRLQVAMADPEADQFVVVKYPAIAEADEYLDEDTDLIVYDTPPANGRLLRHKGEALHPERYDLQKLNRIKTTISPRFWSALYQQNPVPDDGAYFLKEHFRRGEPPPIDRANVFIAWDFAISEKKQNDYTVGTVGLQDEDDVLHVAEIVRFKSGDAHYIVESILNLCSRWYSPGLQLGFEDGQIYRAIESLLKKRMRERRVYPAITVLKPITDKMARARPLQGRMQQGMVSFNAHGDWYDACRTEMLRFPAGVHDDQVDSISWMTQLAIGREPPHKPRPKAPKSWRDKLAHIGAGSFMSA
jgi:predicted phage terminase large subunit-like protein